MGFGKRIWEFLIIVAVFLIIGALVWYLMSAIRESKYENQGTLVMNSQEFELEEEAYPAFVTDPWVRIMGQQEIQRSGKGI